MRKSPCGALICQMCIMFLSTDPLFELPFTQWPPFKMLKPHTQWPSLFEFIYLMTPCFGCFLLLNHSHFSTSCYKNCILVICFGIFVHIYIHLSCLAYLALNGPYSMNFYPMTCICTEWPRFKKNVYWMTPFFEVFTGCPKQWVGTYLSLQTESAPPPTGGRAGSF